MLHSQAQKSLRASTDREFARYMATHKISVILDLLVSNLAETQPQNPLQQMHQSLGEMLRLESSEASYSEACEASNVAQKNAACRLYLSGRFEDATGQTRPFRMHMAASASSFTSSEAHRWARAVDLEIKQLFSVPTEGQEGQQRRGPEPETVAGGKPVNVNANARAERSQAEEGTDLPEDVQRLQPTDGIRKATSSSIVGQQAGSVDSGTAEPPARQSQIEGVVTELGGSASSEAQTRKSKLSWEEVQEEVRKAGEDISEGELAGLFKEVDEDGDGKVTMEELADGMKARPALGSVRGMASLLGSQGLGVLESVASRAVRCYAARTGVREESVETMALLREVDAEQDLRQGWRAAEEEVVAAFARELETVRAMAGGVVTKEAFNDKYAAEPGTFEGKYKEIGAFRAGVEGALGLPGKDIMAGMEMEFCHAADSADEFTTSNYGGSITTPRREWEFVVAPQPEVDYAGGRGAVPLRVFLLASSAVKANSEDERYDTPLEALAAEERGAVKMVLLRRVKEGGVLPRAGEAAADPRLQALAASGEARLRSVQRELGAVLREWDGAASRGIGEFGRVSKEVRRRCGLEEEEVEGLLARARARLARARLLEEEVIALRLYTGPSFMKLNGTLRERDVGQKGNDYVCTIFAVISAMAKLAEATPIPDGRVVYRGQKGMRLPEAFWKGNEEGVKGGVEMAFLSTTTELEVAVGYAASGALPTVFSIQVGAIDKGAALSFLSEYPNEDEMLMPPRSFLEVVGEPSVQHTPKGPVLSIPVKINCNLQCPTLEKLRKSRKTMLVSTLRHVQKEVARDVDAALESDELKERAKADIFWKSEKEDGGKQFVTSIKDEAKKALESAEQRAAGWYNDDMNFRREMQEALDVARRAMGKLRLWLEDSSLYTQSLNRLSARDCDRKAAGRLQRQMDEAEEAIKEDEGATDREKVEAAAHRLCQHMELLDAEIDRVNGTSCGETNLMVRAADGDETGVGLLVAARANVEASRIDGMTALMLAAQRGSVGVVRRLAGNGAANPDAQDKGGQTALMYAAENGHVRVIRTLVNEYGSDKEVRDADGMSAWHYAAYDGHLGALQVLWEEGKTDPNVATNRGFTAVLFAAQNGHEEVLTWLLEVVGADPNLKIDTGRTALMMAAEAGHAGVVKKLVEATGAVAGDQDDSGRTALIVAAFRGHQGVVQCLVEAGGFDANARDVHGATAVIIAAGNGHEGVVRWLVEVGGADANAKDDEGRTAVLMAARHGREDLVKWLVEAGGADANAALKGGRTAAMIAALAGHVGVLKQLVELGGADADAKDAQKRTAVMYAAEGAQEGAMRWLVSVGGADPNARDKDSRTAAMIAALARREGALKWLVEVGGADANVKDKHGRTAVMYAAQKGLEEGVKSLVTVGRADANARDNSSWTAVMIAALAGHHGVVMCLVEVGGADAHAKDKDGRSALMYAARNGHQDVVTYLVEVQNVDSTVKDVRGMTAVLIAAEAGHAEVVSSLVVGGADADVKDGDGRTAVMYAARNGHKGAMQSLVEVGGADVHAKDKDGRTAVNIAAESGHEEVVQWLAKQGADLEDATQRGGSVLMAAASRGHLSLCRWLVQDAGVDVRRCLADEGGFRALHFAEYAAREEVAQFLAEAEETVAGSEAEGLGAVRRRLREYLEQPLALHRGALGGVRFDAKARTVTFRGFSSVRYKHPCPAGRKAYYELRVLAELTLPQLGFAGSSFDAVRTASGDGVGDDAHSWGVDGNRSQRWHKGSCGAWGVKWSVGDVIGLACDLEGQRILVSLNGDFAAPNGVVFELAAPPDELFAAFSAESGTMEYNFGEGGRAFSYQPPEADYTALGLLRVSEG